MLNVLKKAAVNTNICKPQSTRHALLFKLKSATKLPVILAKGGCSSVSAFRKHKDLPIMDETAVRIDTNDNIKKQENSRLEFFQFF